MVSDVNALQILSEVDLDAGRSHASKICTEDYTCLHFTEFPTRR